MFAKQKSFTLFLSSFLQLFPIPFDDDDEEEEAKKKIVSCINNGFNGFRFKRVRFLIRLLPNMVWLSQRKYAGFFSFSFLYHFVVVCCVSFHFI